MTCALCGGESASSFLDAGSSHMVKCCGCGLVYVANFQDGATSYEGEDYFTVKNRYAQRWDEFCTIFDGLVEKITRINGGGGRLLDVGAGVGALMWVAKRKGFDVRGVEVSQWAAAFAREEKGLDVAAGSLEDAGFAASSFEVAVINHVLEHVPDPQKVLEEVRRVLSADGMLVVGVPNIASFMARLRGKKWSSLRPEEHRWHFSPDTLRRLVRQAGFDEVHFEARENHPVAGWGPAHLARRVINGAATLTGRSEAMLIFARKGRAGG